MIPLLLLGLVFAGAAAADGAAPPRPPFGLRTEYLGAAPSDLTAPAVAAARSGERCTGADGSAIGGVISEWAGSSDTRPAPPLQLSCKSGVITRVEAFFGTPAGSCASGFTRRAACDAPNAAAVVDALCLHKPGCTVPTAANETHWKGTSHPSPLAALFLPDPCMGTSKVLAVKVTCSAGQLDLSPGGDTARLQLHGRSPLAPPPPSPPPSPALGIDAVRPRFSWMLNSNVRGDTQAAYELKVVQQFDQSVVVWSSGKV
eukprot:SAG11_NODE_524_length_8751_cov_4.292765_1_plen_259_part_00